MLERVDYDLSRRIELALALAGQQGRVVSRKGSAWGVELSRAPARGALAVLSSAIAAALGVPVSLARRGRRLLVVAK